MTACCWRTSTPVMSVNAATFEASTVRFCFTKAVTSASAADRLRSAAASSSFSPASCSATSASCWLKPRTCWSLRASAVVKRCRLATEPNRSCRPSARVVSARDSPSRVSCRFPPLPWRLARPVATRSDRAPSALAPCGPRARLNSSSAW
ncbi:hypothetical protein JNW87_21985 [Micromonospora sp. ATA51]|nr:hypothetical protein [Micromonospora sp. ATA51]MBM0227789.1 hypothetical protein [Micromonospora sp. ATA51]